MIGIEIAHLNNLETLEGRDIIRANGVEKVWSCKHLM